MIISNSRRCKQQPPTVIQTISTLVRTLVIVMRREKTLTISLIVFLCSGTAGCKKASTGVSQQNNSQAAVPAPGDFHHPEGGTTPVAQTKFFDGSIGSTLGLQMKLIRDGEQLTGHYSYKKIGTRIDLKGTVDKEGNLTLVESDSNGKQTGAFSGLWKADQDGMITISGNWSQPQGQKKTAFSVHEEPIAFSGGAEIVARQIKENNKKLKYTIDVEYPQLTGATGPNFEKFNQTVRSLVSGKVAGFKKEMAAPEANEAETESQTEPEAPASDLGIGYTIALAKDDLVSVLLDIGGYYSGAAHPNSYSETINFDLKNGSKLKLADLFKPGAKYLQTISTYCVKDLKRQSKEKDSLLDDSTIASGAGPDEKNFKSWTITRKGLELTFDAYQVGPYAAGPQTVIVPYAVLKEIVKPEGLISEFVK